VLVAAAVPAWQWIDHSIKARAAYAEGRTNAESAIAGGHLVIDGRGPTGMEVFVDPRTGLQTSEPGRCCVIEEFDEYRREGFYDEVDRAFLAGELSALDLRPKLRTEEEVLALFAEHADQEFVIGPTTGRAENPNGAVALTWSVSNPESPWALVQAFETGNVERSLINVNLQLPARALFVDEGTTLLLIEPTTAVQIVDLENRARLAWYGGWMSSNPRN
jgi:hypothetical protein